MTSPVFTDWDGRPAVLFSDSRGEALALLKPGGDWVPVDALDVFHTARVLDSAEALKSWFASGFGDFDIPTSFANDASSRDSAAE